MNTLHDTFDDVHSNLLCDLPGPDADPADSAWWAELCDSHESDRPAPGHTDRRWMRDESDGWLERTCGEDLYLGRSPAADFAGLVAHELRAVAGSMSFHRADDAATYCRAKGIDLGRLWVPLAGARRSALASALDVEASYYLHLDTDAGRLAAWHLQYLADLCEDLGSQTVEDYRVDEAAWHAAALDAVMEG